MTKKAWEAFCPLLLTRRSTASRILPDLLGVPSTFCTLWGLTSFLVVNLRCSTAYGWIKHSVAPQSSSAFWSTCFVLVRSWKGTWIAWFWAIYIEPVASGTRTPQSQLQTRNFSITWPWEHITWPSMWPVTWPLCHSYITWLISTWSWEPTTTWPWEDNTWPIKELVINNVTWQDALWTRV